MRVIAQAYPASAITAPLTSTAAATTAFSIINGGPNAGTQCNLNVPGSNRIPGPYTVRATGYFYLPGGTYTSGSAGSTWQVWLCASNTNSFAAATGNALVKASMAFTVTSAVSVARPFGIVPWEVEAECFAGNTAPVDLAQDGTGNHVGYGAQGYGSLNTKCNFSLLDPNGVATGAAAPTNGLNAVSNYNSAAEPPCQFAVAIVTAANSSNGYPAGTSAVLQSLVLEA